MEEARSWIIGLAVLAIVTVGIATWITIVPTRAALLEEAADTVALTTVPADQDQWGDASPNFITGVVEEEHEGGNSAGWGRFSVEEICLQEGVDPDQAKSRLATFGLAIDLSQRIRELADSSGYKPSEVVDILLGKDPGEGCDDPDCDGDCDSESGSGHESGGESCDDSP